MPADWLATAEPFTGHDASQHPGRHPRVRLDSRAGLLDGTPALSQQLLALEAQRRLQLGEQLARERRGRSDPGLLGEDDLHQQDHQPTAAANAGDPPYVQLHQVCVDLRGRDQRRSLRRMLLERQGPSGLRPLALDQLNLRIDRGERVGLLGHNGSGKTTLLRLLSIYSPTGGRIERHGPALAPVIEQSLGFPGAHRPAAGPLQPQAASRRSATGTTTSPRSAPSPNWATPWPRRSKPWLGMRTASRADHLPGRAGAGP